MSEVDLMRLREQTNISHARLRLAQWIECRSIQLFIISVIILNAVVLGLETSADLTEQYGELLKVIDKACLLVSR